MRYSLPVAAVLACLCGPLELARATTLTITDGRTVRLKQLADYNGPVNDASSPADNSGRLFVVQQNGTIQIIQNGAPVGAYLNLATFAGTNFGNFGNETGLLGLAFHPDFANPGTPGYGKFYTYSSQSRQGNADFFNTTNYGASGSENLTQANASFENVVREWTVNTTTSSTGANTFVGTSRVVMTIAKAASNHNGGALAFGTAPGDTGNLYISTGDGGDGNDHAGNTFTDNNDGHTNNVGNAQDKNVIYGKILRINPLLNHGADPSSANGQYGIPSTNPFSGATPGLDEIFAYGFRNPFRISFDRLTNDLYVGDVGQGAREEVDRIPVQTVISNPLTTVNYGWVNKEGTLANPNSPSPPNPIVGPDVNPFAEYTHPAGGAVIGGFVNRGPYLTDLLGYYIFGDLTTQLLYVDPNDVNGVIKRFVIDTTNGGAALSAVNGFGRDQEGDLYVLLADGRVLLIPEPATGLLALAGLSLGLTFAVVRRGKQQQPHQARA